MTSFSFCKTSADRVRCGAWRRLVAIVAACASAAVPLAGAAAAQQRATASTPRPSASTQRSAVASTQRLPAPIKSAIAASGLPARSFGLYAQEVEGDRILAALNADEPYVMASTTKIVTSLAALDLLGPQWHWRTAAYALGAFVGNRLQGDLVILGGGDATLTTAQLHDWFARLHAEGLDVIEGDIVVDRSAVHLDPAEQGRVPTQAPDRPRHVWPDALTLDEGLVSVELTSSRNGRPTATLSPPLADVRVVNQVQAGGGCSVGAQWRERAGADHMAEVVVSGAWSAGCGQRSVSFVPPLGSGYAARALAGLWRASGGKLGGRVVSVARSETGSAEPLGADGVPLRPFASLTSKPLSDVVRDMNKASNNVTARSLLLALSPGFPERVATLAGAHHVLQHWLARKGLGAGDITLENGSGLSRGERAKPRAMVELLKVAWRLPHAQAFIDSLPIAGVDGTLAHRLGFGKAAGQAWLKTGTLNDTRALAGYVRGASGKVYAVAIMVHDVDAALGRPAMDAFIEWVARNG